MDGSKRFEIRKNDRDFKEGDKIILLHFDHEKKEYTSRPALCAEIGFLTDYEQKEGYVVFSLINNFTVRTLREELERGQYVA